MAEQADRRSAPPRRREPAPQHSMHGHPMLERRAADQPAAGYRAMLNARPTGPRPIQRASNRTGLPDRLKAGVEALSGLSMDGVKVHYGSPRPAELDAHAYAQGGDIHLAPGQEQHLPHEAWHVVQQAQGRVKPTMQVNSGVPVNDDPGLEREADAMGARSERLEQSDAMAQRAGGTVPPHGRLAAQTVQRSVVDFNATVEGYHPPGTDIINSLEEDNFTQTPKQVYTAIRSGLNDPLVKLLNVPTQVVATLVNDGAVNAPARQASRSRNIGLIGRDEFWIKRGQAENFEGGHLIPHALWDVNDADVGQADSYDNLVPMSRTMNVMDWADREDRIRAKLFEIDQDDQLEVTIDITRQTYPLPYRRLAQMFNLTLDQNADPDSTIDLYGWLPVRGEPSWRHIETGSSDEMTQVEENPLRDTHTEITTPNELIEHLQLTGAWNQMSEDLRGKIENL